MFVGESPKGHPSSNTTLLRSLFATSLNWILQCRFTMPLCKAFFVRILFLGIKKPQAGFGVEDFSSACSWLFVISACSARWERSRSSWWSADGGRDCTSQSWHIFMRWHHTDNQQPLVPPQCPVVMVLMCAGPALPQQSRRVSRSLAQKHFLVNFHRSCQAGMLNGGKSSLRPNGLSGSSIGLGLRVFMEGWKEKEKKEKRFYGGRYDVTQTTAYFWN